MYYKLKISCKAADYNTIYQRIKLYNFSTQIKTFNTSDMILISLFFILLLTFLKI